ncbi:MAG: type II toxin-antitoxin system RelE/ParE family toxin [Nitrospirota bacterium]|nr:type II toxin-antitoxin system RelE/ParE family toxin [Nitrospirota bacterium]
MAITIRNISWIKQAKKDFLKFPENVQIKMTTALDVALEGEKADLAKPLKGFQSSVFEISVQYQTNAYRSIYALKLDDDIWVIHVFQKKSKTGIKTPRVDIDLIRSRIKELKRILK